MFFIRKLLALLLLLLATRSKLIQRLCENWISYHRTSFLNVKFMSKSQTNYKNNTSYGQHHWTPPKGHVDPGESDWITALRETREEAGLSEDDLEIYKDITKTLHYDVKGKPKDVVYWLAKLRNPECHVKLSDEHQDLKWLPLKQAQEISGFEDMKQLLAEFNEKAAKL